MIIGIGIDIIKTERIEQLDFLHGHRFMNRIFTEGEQKYCSAKSSKYQSLAARFSAKEAVFKALGKGWTECGFTSVEVITGSSGKPCILLHGAAKKLADEYGVKRIFLSLTHDNGVSAAVVVLEG
jgi:holo-[acyl-carrier protein] synthase